MIISRGKNIGYVCPHCGDGSRTKKPSWCYEIEPMADGRRVTVCNHEAPPADGWEVKNFGELLTSDGKPYYIEKIMSFAIPEKRERKIDTDFQYYDYLDAQGRPFVFNAKKHLAGGGKECKQGRYQQGSRVFNLKGIAKDKILPYRYESLKDVPLDKPVWVFEGEEKCDQARGIGLFPAIACYGGCNGWNPFVADLLKGRKLIIAPDMDLAGIKHQDNILADFPDSQFFYAYDDLAESGGLDIHDLIIDLKKEGKKEVEIRDLILSRVEDTRRHFPQIDGKKQEIKSAKWEHDLVVSEIQDIYLDCIDAIQIDKKLAELVNLSGWSRKEVDQLAKIVREEVKAEEGKADAIDQMAELLRLKHLTLDIYSILPNEVAIEIENRAATLWVRPERFIGYLLAGLSTILGSKLFVQSRKQARWDEYFRIYYADFSPPSGGKTLVQSNALQWMKERDESILLNYMKAKARLEQVELEWAKKDNDYKQEHSDSDENPEIFKKQYCSIPPSVLFEKGTEEAMLHEMSRLPEWGAILKIRDEIIALINETDQYKPRGGDGRQILLEFWNGRNKTKTVLKSKDPVILTGQLFSLAGGIQTNLAKKYLNLSNDLDGFACRFLYCNAPSMPLDVRSESEKDKHPDHVLFQDIFETAEALEPEIIDGRFAPMPMRFSEAAYLFKGDCLRHLDSLGHAQQVINPTLASYIGKMKQYFLVFSGLLHFINSCYLDVDMMLIDLHSTEQAWELTRYYLSQFINAQGASEAYSSGSLAGIYKDIYEYAQTQGTITTREVCRNFRRKIDGKPLDAAKVQEIFEGLAGKGFGIIEKEGKTIKFVFGKVATEATSPIADMPSRHDDYELEASFAPDHQKSKPYVRQSHQEPVVAQEEPKKQMIKEVSDEKTVRLTEDKTIPDTIGKPHILYADTVLVQSTPPGARIPEGKIFYQRLCDWQADINIYFLIDHETTFIIP